MIVLSGSTKVGKTTLTSILCAVPLVGKKQGGRIVYVPKAETDLKNEQKLISGTLVANVKNF